MTKRVLVSLSNPETVQETVAYRPQPGKGGRDWTAKTINQELKALVAHAEKQKRQLARHPGHPYKMAMLAKAEANLAEAIKAALDGGLLRHRGEIAGEKLEQFSARKAKLRAKRIAASYPAKG